MQAKLTSLIKAGQSCENQEHKIKVQKENLEKDGEHHELVQGFKMQRNELERKVKEQIK